VGRRTTLAPFTFGSRLMYCKREGKNVQTSFGVKLRLRVGKEIASMRIFSLAPEFIVINNEPRELDVRNFYESET
jgi:hypothetical protein